MSVNTNEKYRINQIAKVYHSNGLSGLNERYHTYLRDALIPSSGGRSALELGCGNGLWTVKLCSLYERLDVVDASIDLLEHIKKVNEPHADLNTHNALAEDFLEGSSDVWQHIYITFLLEHLKDDVKVLKLAKKCLEPDGRLFIAVPNADSIHRILAVRAGLIPNTTTLSDNDLLVGHRRVYSRFALHEILSCSGFIIEKEYCLGLKPLSLKQLETLPPNVIDALCASGDLVSYNAAYIALSAIPSG